MNTNSKNGLPERERLLKYRNGEEPPGMSTSIAVEFASDDNWLEKTSAVMDLIVRNAQSWPRDEYWQQILPDWLFTSFKHYTPQELAEIRVDRSKWSDLQWSFGSWLDSMQNRSWEWWSLLLTSNRVTIYLSVDGFPFSIKALVYLIGVAGGSVIQ